MIVLMGLVGSAPSQANAETTADQSYTRGLEAANDYRYSAAYSQFLVAAQGGNRDAQRTLALMLFYGEGIFGGEIHRNREQALYWLRKAAQNGCETSAFMLTKLS